MSGASLRGVRILDLTSVVVGPICTARLAQYGAEVIKLEAPEADLMRGLGGLSPTGQHSGAYLHLNRGKRNICCDLKKEGSADLVDRLIANADVIVANMREPALKRLGLDAERIRARHPDKIYCLISGYGSDGPYAGRPTYDSVIQAASGIPGLALVRDGSPAYAPLMMCDHIVGEVAAGSILAALYERARTGAGRTIEVPMFETMASFVLQEHLAQASFLPPVGPAGDQRLLNPANKPVRTADGWIAFTVNTDKQVRAFLQVSGRSALLDDPRFGSVRARAENVSQWFAIRGAALLDHTTAEWLELFEAADIAAMPCHSLETLQRDPHLQAVDLLFEEEHPVEGASWAIRPTIAFDGVYPDAGGFAQPKGWESIGILEECGYAADEIERMIDQGMVVAAQRDS